MAKFVNFKKRSVTLPKGCKDLVDLLRPARNPAITRPVFNAEVGLLDYISKAKVTTVSEVIPVIQTLELPAEKPWFVQLLPVGDDDFLFCFSNPGETPIPRLVLYFLDRPEWKAGVQKVLIRRGLTAANLDESAPPPFPGLPVHCCWRITGPLPDVGEMGALVRELLTEGLGLPADTQVRVAHEFLN